MLSIATPCRYPIVDEPASGPVEPGAGAMVVGAGCAGAGAEGVTLGREVGTLRQRGAGEQERSDHGGEQMRAHGWNIRRKRSLV